MKKYFIITVDTEGDNLWKYKKGETITTINTKYLPRFQSLCNKYGFKPVWLTNYEMASDEQFVKLAKTWKKEGLCEIGIHLHAWNNPPLYNLNAIYNGNPYLVEYPYNIMHEKFSCLYNLIKNKFRTTPVTHRAGRWVMNETYFKLLKEFNIKVDCSVTPGINWKNVKGETQGGCDYSLASQNPYKINGILEVPMTIRDFKFPIAFDLKHIYRIIRYGHEETWMRPCSSSTKILKKLCKSIHESSETDYIEFMIHSSELMPGGSPYFRNEQSIEKLYQTLDATFRYAKSLGFEGITLKEYAYMHF